MKNCIWLLKRLQFMTISFDSTIVRILSSWVYFLLIPSSENLNLNGTSSKPYLLPHTLIKISD